MTFRANEHPDELISASLTGDLSGAERARLDQHLATCERCRDTLAAFGEERRLLAGLHQVSPPRDLGARVRAVVETTPRSVPWWRRPSVLVGAFASAATVAAGVLAVVVLSGLPPGPIGGTHDPTPSASLTAASVSAGSEEPQPSAVETSAPTQVPQVALAQGELGYLSLDAEPFAASRLYFVKEATGEALEVQAPAGPPVTAAISPTGEWLAYITELSGPGVNQVWVVHLTDGATQVLGCSLPNPFTDRLAWSDDGRFLAYTLAEVTLGEGLDCGESEGDGSATNAWLFDSAATGKSVRLTEDGNAFVGDFLQSLGEDGSYRLLISYAGGEPYTEEMRIGGSGDTAQLLRLDGAFAPLTSPNGFRTLLWRGEMAQEEGSGAWRFVRGGMPYITTETSVDPGQPLFADLEPVGGAGFESGRFAWGEDSDQLAFWQGAWTGAPQDDEGAYPSVRDVYIGRLSDGLLTSGSRLELALADDERVIAVALEPNGVSAVVTVARAVAGLAPAEATLYQVRFDGSGTVAVGNGPTWTGPGLYGEEPVELPN